jgi:meso-butanediol dehydrogenase/(S,S)-butanediol dehydrogenase/diacetyl reductase
MMEVTVDRPTAVVTGAAQGIGRAIAVRLARDGMDVVIADLSADRLDVVAREVRALGRHALPLAVNVTDAADRERLFARTLETFGRLDALVNNAGIQRIALPLDVTEEHWDAVMGVNAKATYFCCQRALKHMLIQRRGRIVNVASIAGKMASTIHHPIYNVSKAAVLAMTKTLALAYAADGIRVNAVCPGVIATPMQDVVDREFAAVMGSSPAEVRAERVGRIPVGTIGAPEDVAALVSFLLGPDAHYLTGQALNVDGGLLTY